MESIEDLNHMATEERKNNEERTSIYNKIVKMSKHHDNQISVDPSIYTIGRKISAQYSMGVNEDEIDLINKAINSAITNQNENAVKFTSNMTNDKANNNT